MLREFPFGLLLKRRPFFSRHPATLNQQIGQRARLVTRPGTHGRRELLQIEQLSFKRQNSKQQVLFNRHARDLLQWVAEFIAARPIMRSGDRVRK